MASPIVKRSAAVNEAHPNTPAGSHSLNGIASSPYASNAPISVVTPQSFTIDTFDFGADFSLPSNLDDLAIFHNQQDESEENAVGRSAESQSNGKTSVHSKALSTSSRFSHTSESQHSPGESTSIGKKGSVASRFSKQRGNGGISAKAPSSNNSVIESPRSVHFSPRTALREHYTTTKSSHQSPHAALNMATHEEGTASLNVDELQSLLHAIDSQSASQQSQQQHPQAGISELERLLAEKEQVERMQSLQTAYLRQQIEALQRQNSNTQIPGMEHNIPSMSSEAGTSNMSAAQLMQQFQQLTSQQSPTAGMANMSFSSPFAFSSGAGMSHVQQSPFSSNAVKPGVSASMNQYGLITPVSADAFAHVSQQHPFVSPLSMPGTSGAQMMNMQRAQDPARIMNGSFTPLESPAITPASVFSNIGSSSTSADLFSPLTSPALRPQPNAHDPLAMQLSPFVGPIKGRPKGRGAPGASPSGPIATKSVPRKNRSTTAEARANRARASPLVKPTLPSAMTQSTRKRNESVNGATMPSPLGPNVPVNGSRTQSDNDAKQTPTAFPPLTAGSGSAKPMDASPSEAAASTPSPIEMPPPNGKPLTPSSLMGIKGNSEQNGSLSRSSSLRNAQKASKAAEKHATFAQLSESSSAGGLHNIVPGNTPGQEREAWLASSKASSMGGGGGGGLESRRTSHKAAEQKRRDSLKYCFDELRGMLPAIALDDDVPGGSMLGPDGLLEDQEPEAFTIEEVGDAESARIANRAISKVALLRHSNEYLYRLKHRIGRRERDLANCRREIMELRARLGIPVPPEWSALTASMAGSAAVMGHNMSNVLNLDALAEQTHPHQAAILIAAMQHQRQQQMQAAMADYPHALDGSTDFATMDTST